MHTKPMGEDEGTFAGAKPVDMRCPRCNRKTITVRSWESSCGGYDDDKYECSSCDTHWWVEGPDA